MEKIDTLLEKVGDFLNNPTVLTIFALAAGIGLVLLLLMHPRAFDRPKDKQIDLIEWLGLTGSFVTERYRPMGRAIMVVIVLICGVLVASGMMAMIGLWQALWSIITAGPEHLSTNETVRGYAFALAAIFGLPFLVWRSVVAQQQANITEQSHITDRISKAVEGLGVEQEVSYVGRPVTVWVGESKIDDFDVLQNVVPELPELSIEISRKEDLYLYEDPNTGDDEVERIFTIKYKQWTLEETKIEKQNSPPPWSPTDHVVIKGNWEVFRQTIPNIGVRVGSIYALERIAQDSLRDHVQIMEILCTYIQENAPVSSAKELPTPPDSQKFSTEQWKNDFSAWHSDIDGILDTLRPRADIMAALKVIGRRTKQQRAVEIADTRHHNEGYRLDLRHTNLQGADLRRQNFQRALFTKSRMEGVNFVCANLRGAYFKNAFLQVAELEKAEMQGANLVGTDLQGVNLKSAFLHEATLWQTQLQYAHLNCTQLQGAQFRDTLPNKMTDFTLSDFLNLAVKSMDLSHLTSLTQSQIDQMFGDSTTKLPPKITPPPWHSVKLSWGEFYTQWTALKNKPS
nr:pentapeptide repeat-containing protein [Amylibacter sp.]